MTLERRNGDSDNRDSDQLEGPAALERLEDVAADRADPNPGSDGVLFGVGSAGVSPDRLDSSALGRGGLPGGGRPLTHGPLDHGVAAASGIGAPPSQSAHPNSAPSADTNQPTPTPAPWLRSWGPSTIRTSARLTHGLYQVEERRAGEQR